MIRIHSLKIGGWGRASAPYFPWWREVVKKGGGKILKIKIIKHASRDAPGRGAIRQL